MRPPAVRPPWSWPAKKVNDPVFARSVVDGYDATTDQIIGGTVAQRFGRAALTMHDATNGWTDHNGTLQGPGPRPRGRRPAHWATK
jgi:hypothetical protein